MYDFKTVGEKALEWRVTTRHIQHLCRTGKIKNAVKCAGIWFIPSDASSPLKNTKSNTQSFNFVGTKKKIFDNAIKLFMLNSYEKVSLKNIAYSSNISQSAIYNHFKSKQEILETIYIYYEHYFKLLRSNLKNMQYELSDGSLEEIMNAVSYNLDIEHAEQMHYITKIIFQRRFDDHRAMELIKLLLIEDGIKHIEEVFKNAVEMGRFAPFDTHSAAIFINSINLYKFHCWLSDPSPKKIKKVNNDVQKLYGYVALLVVDLKR